MGTRTQTSQRNGYGAINIEGMMIRVISGRIRVELRSPHNWEKDVSKWNVTPSYPGSGRKPVNSEIHKRTILRTCDTSFGESLVRNIIKWRTVRMLWLPSEKWRTDWLMRGVSMGETVTRERMVGANCLLRRRKIKRKGSNLHGGYVD